MSRYGDLNDDEKLDAVQTLAAREDSAWKLIEAVLEGRIPNRDVPAYVARQLRRVIGSQFVDMWGPVEALPVDVAADFARHRALLTPEAIRAASAVNGRGVFHRTCRACHKMCGDGGSLGPDITGANRTSLEYVFGNVLTPSADIRLSAPSPSDNGSRIARLRNARVGGGDQRALGTRC